MDDNDTGKLSLKNIAVPMIALGLSSDSSFIMKVMKAISPHKFGKKAKVGNPFEVNELTLKEFIKIFKKDQVSELLTDLLCNRIVSRREKARIKEQRAIEKRQHSLAIIKGKEATFLMSKPTSPMNSNEDMHHLVDLDPEQLKQTSSGQQLLHINVDDSEDFDQFQRANTNLTNFGRDSNE